MSTHTKQYLGVTADLLKKLRSVTSAWMSCIGPSIVWSISPLWVEDCSWTKGVLMTIFLILKSSFFPPFLIIPCTNYITQCPYYTMFTQVSARGTHLILSSQRGVLIQGKCSFEGGAHWIYKKDIKMLSTCLLNQTIRTVIITEE